MISLLILAVGGSLPYFVDSTVKNFYALVAFRYELFFYDKKTLRGISDIYFRFMSGMGHVGTFMMSFNLALECVGPKYRTVFGILIETPFAVGGLIVGLVSWAGVREWKLLTLGMYYTESLSVNVLPPQFSPLLTWPSWFSGGSSLSPPGG